MVKDGAVKTWRRVGNSRTFIARRKLRWRGKEVGNPAKHQVSPSAGYISGGVI
jgi:hypothetical protein